MKRYHTWLMEVKKRKNRTFRIRPYSITEKGTPYKEGQPLASLHYTKSRQHSKTIHKKRLQSWYEFPPLNLNKVRGCSATDFYCLQNYKKIIIKTLQDNFEPDFVERCKLTTPQLPFCPRSARANANKTNQAQEPESLNVKLRYTLFLRGVGRCQFSDTPESEVRPFLI